MIRMRNRMSAQLSVRLEGRGFSRSLSWRSMIRMRNSMAGSRTWAFGGERLFGVSVCLHVLASLRDTPCVQQHSTEFSLENFASSCFPINHFTQ